MYICVNGIDLTSGSTIFRLNCGTVLTWWYFLIFIFITVIKSCEQIYTSMYIFLPCETSEISALETLWEVCKTKTEGVGNYFVIKKYKKK